MPKKILVVDNSEIVRNFYCYILKTSGFEVISAVDGADALEKLHKYNNIGLIITEIDMPNMDGYTLIKKIRSDEEYKDIPIMIVSMKGDTTTKQDIYKTCADVYITKPAKPDKLIESVKLLLEEKDETDNS